jgi:Leucine-rich repeat (LRR) protein
LSKLPALRNVTIDGDSVSAEGLALLPTMKSLEELYLDNTPKMDTIVGMLPELPKLKRLTLGTGLTDEGLPRLRGMRSLRELSIGPSRITAKGLTALASLPSLQVLTLYQADLASGDEWATLGKLSSLQRLTLMHTRSKVTDADVAHLVGLQSLENLALSALVIEDRKPISRLDVTDEGLTHIAKLKRLERLSLSGASITDDGLQQLAVLPELEWLDLQGCSVSEQGLERLKKRLPGLRWYLSRD